MRERETEREREIDHFVKEIYVLSHYRRTEFLVDFFKCCTFKTWVFIPRNVKARSQPCFSHNIFVTKR